MATNFEYCNVRIAVHVFYCPLVSPVDALAVIAACPAAVAASLDRFRSASVICHGHFGLVKSVKATYQPPFRAQFLLLWPQSQTARDSSRSSYSFCRAIQN